MHFLIKVNIDMLGESSSAWKLPESPLRPLLLNFHLNFHSRHRHRIINNSNSFAKSYFKTTDNNTEIIFNLYISHQNI